MAHGGDRYRNSVELDFSVNLNPLGVHEKIKESIIENIDKLEYYPDSEIQELGQKLSEIISVKRENIVFGNGASELITAVISALTPKKILLPVPSFKGYEKAIEASGGKIIEYKMKGDFEITEDITEKITDDIDILFLTNPNNPTGKYINGALLEKIIKRCEEKQTAVVLDECFMELSDEPEKNSFLGRYEKYPHLCILRAFTKSFAIPGVRLGYLVCSGRELLDSIKDRLPEWNISVMAQIAGASAIDLLKDEPYLENARRLIKDQRSYLEQSLTGMGFDVTSSDTCFLLIRHRNLKTNLYTKLLKRGVLIRDCSDYRNLEDGYFRIAVKTEKENKRLISEIQEIIKGYV